MNDIRKKIMTLRKIKLILSVNGVTIKVKEIIDKIT